MVGADQSLTTFIHDELFPLFLSENSPRRVNSLVSFGLHIENRYNLPKLVASEYATLWHRQLLDRLERLLTEWDQLGVPRPFVMSNEENLLLSWQHPKYAEFVTEPGNSLPKHFSDIYRRILAATSKEFLIYVALSLLFIGCSRIYLTDASGDEGVDCLGVLETGTLRSINIVVQAKTSNSRISRNMILTEYGKYLSLPHTEKYLQYRNALTVDKRLDGSAWLYIFMSNQEFDNAARQAASRLGILLRSRKQLALLIGNQIDKTVLDHVIGGLGLDIKPDLTKNLVPILQQLIDASKAASISLDTSQ